MCDVISFATPLDGIREHMVPLGLVLAEAARAHEFPLICHCVKSTEYSVFLEHRRGGVEISTLLSGMMINHSTLEYHVTNFHTFSRWLIRTIQNSSPLL